MFTKPLFTCDINPSIKKDAHLLHTFRSLDITRSNFTKTGQTDRRSHDNNVIANFSIDNDPLCDSRIWRVRSDNEFKERIAEEEGEKGHKAALLPLLHRLQSSYGDIKVVYSLSPSRLTVGPNLQTA